MVITAAFAVAADAQTIRPQLLQALRYRYIGPQGNRVTAVAGVPGNSNIIYAGAATGGVWKTVDGGTHWRPIFDQEDVGSIGAISVAPSDPNVIWVGTGEAFIRGNISIGDGIYKSTDGGAHWTHVGLATSGRIARVVIDPRDPNRVYAAVLGTCYGPQQERGIYRTEDGGKTWQRVLFVNQDTGGVDVALDPSNPRILFAAMWQVSIRPWNLDSGGPGSGIYESRDGGSTWEHLTGHGLPPSPLGRIGLAIAPSRPSWIYALIETGVHGHGVLWRSQNSGATWSLISRNNVLNMRPHYFSRLAVEPDNPNQVWFMTIAHPHVSIDGGATVRTVNALMPDNHDVWIDPLGPDRVIIANDRYVNITTNRGQSWRRVALPIAQMYHVATDDRIPYWVYGNRQDGPSWGSANNTLNGKLILPREWSRVGGSESGWTFPDPANPNFVWSSGSEGSLEHLDLRTGLSRSVNPWPDKSWPSPQQKYRMQWTFPIALSPHDPHRLYAGSQYLMVTEDGGQRWKVISPDLTRNDPTKEKTSGGLSPDNLGVMVDETLFAIAESPLDENVIWAGSADGLVQVTRDGGRRWRNVTHDIPNLPPWGAVTSIAPSRFHAGTAYITVDRHQMNDRNPYVYETHDYGASWHSIASDLPRGTFSYADCIVEDPVRSGLLYLGVENGIYASFDSGGHWIPLQFNLPHTRVSWITVQRRFNDLVLSTYGRGIWILDDIAPLQQMNGAVLASPAYLFAPRTTYRFLVRAPLFRMTAFDPPTLAGRNPPGDAVFNYYLAAPTKARVILTVTDAEGKVVRTLTGTGKRGLNRVWWNLRYEAMSEVLLRTTATGEPLEQPSKVHLGNPTPLVPPGRYTVRLMVNGAVSTQQLTVVKDPNSDGTIAGIAAQTEDVMAVRSTLGKMNGIVDEIESVRHQLLKLHALLASDPAERSLADSAASFNGELLTVENKMFSPQAVGGEPYYYPPTLYSRLDGLVSEITSSDFAPTAATLQVQKIITGQVASERTRLDSLLHRDLPAFNAALRRAGVPNVITPTGH